MWAKVKTWWLGSGTILLNRLEVITGIFVAAIAGMDWSPLWSFFGTGTNFDTRQLGYMSVYLVIRGIAGEIVRRRNAIVTDAGLLKDKK